VTSDLANLVADLAIDQGLDLVVLFGSSARGDDHEGSDLDLLVASDENARPQRRRFAAELEEKMGRVVDVVDLDTALRQPWLLLSIVQDAQVILDRHNRWESIRSLRDELVHRASQDHSSLVAAAQAALAEMRGDDG
jgi:predicted nucleotidyltransferase